jgi:hypothetical protein
MGVKRRSYDPRMSTSKRFLLTGLVTGVTDGLFACVLGFIYYHSFTRLWQGVASTLLGPAALQGGTRTALIGLLMHFGVAFFWSAVFLFVVLRVSAVRRLVDSPGGVVLMAFIYGPLIWLVMSYGVIPLLVHRPPTITIRWWIQLIGHIPFVGLPIVGCSAGAARDH